MNRCTLQSPIAAFLIAICALPAGTAALFPSEVQAQGLQRPFPPAARRAFLQVAAAPEILLNGNPERLSPGARIRSATNSLVMPANIAGQRLLVNYVRDPQGMVHEVWILTEAEAQERRPGLETVFNFRFGSEADQPKRDDGRTPFNELPKFPNQ